MKDQYVAVVLQIDMLLMWVMKIENKNWCVGFMYNNLEDFKPPGTSSNCSNLAGCGMPVHAQLSPVLRRQKKIPGKILSPLLYSCTAFSFTHIAIDKNNTRNVSL